VILALCALYAAFRPAPISAAAIADSVAFQGRLTDESDNPIPDGNRDLILSVWDAPDAGNMLYSEVRVVNVSKGLYSTCLGCDNPAFFDIFGEQSLYLQVQLAGQPPMTPRTAIRNAPRALLSSRVRGDVGTAPGLMVVGDTASGSYARVQAGLQNAAGVVATGVSRISNDCDDTDAEVFIGHSQGGNTGPNIRMNANSDSTEIALLQSDAGLDGGLYIQGKNIRKNITAHLANIDNSSTTANLTADTAASSLTLDHDEDGDGVSETTIFQGSSSESAALNISGINNGMPNRISMNVTVGRLSHTSSITQGSDIDGDGLDETSMSSTIKRKSGSIIVLDREGSEAFRSMVGVDSTRGIITTDHDSDGDGMSESRLALVAQAAGSFTRAESDLPFSVGPRQSTSFDATPDSAAMRCVTDIDRDGIPDLAVSVHSDAATARLSINTKGTGAKRLSAGGDCDDTDATFHTTCDSDGDGVPDVGSEFVSDETRSILKQYFQSGDVPTQTQRVITLDGSGVHTSSVADLDGDGLADRVIKEDCDDTDASVSIEGSGVQVSMRHKGWDGTIKGSFRIDNNGQRTINLDGDGVAYLDSSLGIGVLNPTNPIDHSSGAKLTSGGVWTNASDRDLKENFLPINGEELLEKIEQLPISEWNYKVESDNIRHIGPTAQDFKAIFGVGSDGKSISTVDPSGIALAAIKELY
jgi:hypothetical protein